jgi:hypothetical protein
MNPDNRVEAIRSHCRSKGPFRSSRIGGAIRAILTSEEFRTVPAADMKK